MLKNENKTEKEEVNNKAPEAPQDFSDLLKQFEAEYVLGHDHQKEELKENLSRLKLYNNQKKDKKRVADTSLFSIMQTMLAALYVNALSVVFDGNDDGDGGTAENLNNMAKYDYKVMMKHILDYYLIWDTCFLGYGLIEMEEFDRDKMLPVPNNIDGMTFIRDPKAISPNGVLNGSGAMRFGGYPIDIKKTDLNPDNGYFDYDGITIEEEIDSLMKDAQDARDQAEGYQTLRNKNISSKDMGDNVIYPAFKWFTHHKGNKIKMIVANNRQRIIKYEVIGKSSDPKVKFPIIKRDLFPNSKSWSGTSIPDLVEDKQRQKSVMLNLALDSVKSATYPAMVYAENRIKNKADLKRIKFNKLIGVKGEADIRGAVAPLAKDMPRMDLINYILDALDGSAQIATGSPEMQQGQLSGKSRTLGELNLVQSNVTKRHTLAGRIFGWSEHAFWEMWYELYKKHFKSGIDEKMIRITGAYGNRWRKLTKENMTYLQDPDITIEDNDTNESRNARERILMTNYGNVIINDPEANQRYFRKNILGKLNGLDHEQLERLYPPSVDELLALEENEKLSNNDLVPVGENDNHEIHIEQHMRAAQTNALDSHVKAHRTMQRIKKNQPDIFPQENPIEGLGEEVPQAGQRSLSAQNAVPNINLEV